ncbi:MAG: hypothetical protein ABIO92_01505 [Chloroflexia bacterium]
MKECLNPNCTLYTRLEELPDAYTKCPTCDGPLATAGNKAHPSTILSGASLPMYGQQKLHTEFDPTLGHAVQPGPEVYGPLDQADYQDEYAYGDQDSDGFVDAQQPRGSSVARIAFLGAALLFVLVCGVAAFVLSGQVFSRTRIVSGPQATETALSYILPAINTPIPIRPTIQQPVGTNGDTIRPTSPPPIAPIPTATTQPVIVAQPPAATPPPAQPQAGGGVLSGQMSVRFEGGEPVGITSVYKPDDTMNLAVQANFGEGGVRSVLTRWYGPGNSPIYELRKEYPQMGTYYTGFTLKNATPWPPGDYRVDIHPNDSPVPAYSVPFSVMP